MTRADLIVAAVKQGLQFYRWGMCYVIKRGSGNDAPHVVLYDVHILQDGTYSYPGHIRRSDDPRHRNITVTEAARFLGLDQ